MSGPQSFDVVDIETSCLKDSEGEWRSEPWFVSAEGTSPKGILFGFYTSEIDGANTAAVTIDEQPMPIAGDVLVGHNIKFDASHYPALRDRPVVWDTMIAEYILSAQQAQFAKLKDLGTKYASHLPQKGDLIQSNLDAGIPPQELELGELREYLALDLEITAAVFKCQWALATPEQKALIFIQSSASMAYGAIEANGLALDVAYTIDARDRTDIAAAESVEKMRRGVAYLTDEATANDLVAAGFIMSPTCLSMLLFGSPVAAEVSVPLTADELLNAPKRRKNRKIAFKSPAGGSYSAIKPADVGATSRGAFYGTDDSVLERISVSHNPVPATIANIVREYRGHAKLSKTYYTAWLNQIESYADRRLHPKIHSTATYTGRTSSSNPNVQNIPDAARTCVTSRYDGGLLLEMDFRQLEVIGLAQVSQCPALVAALNRGDDIHYISGQRVFGWRSPSAMDKENRRVVKTINFGLIYGGSAKALAAQAGVDEELAAGLIKAFYEAFPGVKKWQQATFNKVASNPDAREVVASAHGTTTVHKLTTPTGRTYAFPLEPRPNWTNRPGGSLEFGPSPTKVKNYPVQGFATGDVVPLAVMLVDRALRERAPHAVMCNVVHDSMLFDVPNTPYAGHVAATVENVITHELPNALKHMWGIEMSVPLTVDFSTPSTTWKAR